MKKEEYKNIKILYVDDEQFIRENALEYLSRHFDNVYEAKDAFEALEIHKNIKPDIIITDINMPKLNGIELTKMIRKEDKKVQIIIATAFTDTQYLLDAIELQLVKYLIKPILDLKLISAINDCIKILKDDSSNIRLIHKNVSFDIFNKTLLFDQRVVKLTKNEILFLEILCTNANRAVTYREIENYVWRENSMTSDALRSLVRALRRKLPEDCINNLSGIGYLVSLIK